VKEIAGLVVVVTGASAGIGRATAVSLAKLGANVVLTGRRTERLTTLIDELVDSPGRRLAVAGDIRDEQFARELIDRTVNEFGRLDVLVNNAGLGHHSSLADMPLSDVRTILDTNVVGLLAATQTAVTQMKAQGSGHIINVSSIVGQRPLPHNGIYTASKTAVNFITRTLRMELRPYKIIVTAVYPGLTATEFGQAKLGRSGRNRWGLSGIPAERVGEAVVKAVRYGRTEVYVTLYDWLITHVCRLFPRLIDWFLMTRIYLAG